MGQSQLLIIAVSVLIIGIALLAGTGFFQSEDVEASKKAVINDINHIAMNARRYYSRPGALAGGNQQYTGYVIPTRYRSNGNGVYSTTLINSKVLQITGKWLRDSTASATAQIDSYGKASNWTYTGDFQ
jgi:hypothetical protein